MWSACATNFFENSEAASNDCEHLIRWWTSPWRVCPRDLCRSLLDGSAIRLRKQKCLLTPSPRSLFCFERAPTYSVSDGPVRWCDLSCWCVPRKLLNDSSNWTLTAALGQTRLFAWVLQMCSHQLCLPWAKVICRILEQGFWPSAWVIHWVVQVPLHKRKSKSEAGNSRAIDLTTQVSKEIELYLSQFFVPTLETRASSIA